MIELLRLARKFIHEKRLYRFYRYVPRQGQGQPHDNVKVYASWQEIPEPIQQAVIPSRHIDSMYYRLGRGQAKLLCYTEKPNQLMAYGWVQDWQPFRRKFHMLAKEGIMLGPYWTAEECRGRGIYGVLLQHSLSLCEKDKPILIYTSPENLASQRGIEKAGFHFLGDWQVNSWLRVFMSQTKIPLS